MSGHTEGPWQHGTYNSCAVCGPDGDKQQIAVFSGQGSKNIVNTRLAIASPAMLAALRGLMGEAEDRIAYIDTTIANDRKHGGMEPDQFDDYAAERSRWQAVIDAVYLATGETP